VLEAGAGVGGEQEGGQVDGEEDEHEPDHLHGSLPLLVWS
jgi:hypothetical protein